MTAGYVSVVGGALLQGVVTLIGTLEQMPAMPPNEVQAGQSENGYSAGIIVLAAAVVESFLNRTRYIRADGLANGREPVTQYWTRIGPSLATNNADSLAYAELAADLDECFAVRDVIVHSHLWEAQVQWNGGGVLEFVGRPQIQVGYGDRRFRALMDGQTRQSRRLRLNLFPSRVWRRDAWTVLKTANALLRVLEASDRRYCYMNPQPFEYRGEHAHFHDIVGQLPVIAP